MNNRSAMEWPAKDLFRATALVHNIVDSIGEQTMIALTMDGEVEDFSQLFSAERGDKEVVDWLREVKKAKAELSDEEAAHYKQTMDVLCHIGINLLTEYRKFLREIGMASNPLPDPDAVTIPDTADDIEW